MMRRPPRSTPFPSPPPSQSKEGFLRSDKSLIQTIGRAARNVSGQVIMYADKVTPSMELAIDETNRRREKQVAYNARSEEHTSELQSRQYLVCRLLLEKKKFT